MAWRDYLPSTVASLLPCHMKSVLPRFCYISLMNLRSTRIQLTKQLHAQLIINGVKSQSIVSKLICRYCSSSSSEGNVLAYLIFTHFGPSNLFLFNSLLRCSSANDSIKLFANHASEHQLGFDYYTFIFVLGACARSGSGSTLSFGRQIHACVLKYGFLPSYLLIQTTLIHFYGNKGELKLAREVFDEMPHRNTVTFNAMISAYASHKGKCKAYAREALVLFRVMIGDHVLSPSDTTLVCVLTAVSRSGDLETGVCVHGYIQKSGHEPEFNVFIGTGLVDMYSKCGCLSNAFAVFNMMRVRNVLTWTSMATGLAFHGRGKEALALVDEMQGLGIHPNEVTFTSILFACCQEGLIQEGLQLFENLASRFNMSPSMRHYSCIVDLLGRAGLIKEAYEFVLSMPFKPDGILWRSLLNASRIHGDLVMGEKIGKILTSMESLDMGRDCEDFVALSNVYALANRWGEVEMVRKEMKDRGIRAQPGSSIVQTSN